MSEVQILIEKIQALLGEAERENRLGRSMLEARVWADIATFAWSRQVELRGSVGKS